MWSDRVYYKSTLVKSTKYNHEDHLLEVVFGNGETKIYTEIPSAVARSFEECAKSAASAGDFFRNEIQDKYHIQKED